MIPSNEIALSRGSSQHDLNSASNNSYGPGGLRAIMPPPPGALSDSMISSAMSLESLLSDDMTVTGDDPSATAARNQIANDFAIDITHIEKMVQDTDAAAIMDKRPLDGVQSCLKSLRDQMSNLQVEQEQNVRASTQWRYRLGFTCEKCEMKW